MSSKIIGISGVSGSGKTTLSQELGKELAATMVVWDDFDEVSEGPSDYVEWYHMVLPYSCRRSSISKVSTFCGPSDA